MTFLRFRYFFCIKHKSKVYFQYASIMSCALWSISESKLLFLKFGILCSRKFKKSFIRYSHCCFSNQFRCISYKWIRYYLHFEITTSTFHLECCTINIMFGLFYVFFSLLFLEVGWNIFLGSNDHSYILLESAYF